MLFIDCKSLTVAKGPYTLVLTLQVFEDC